jgi:hypothetical protein
MELCCSVTSDLEATATSAREVRRRLCCRTCAKVLRWQSERIYGLIEFAQRRAEDM